MNYKIQFYKTIPLQLIKRSYGIRKAKRFTINNTNQNENIDYIFRNAQRQLELAGITYAIPGIKRRSK